MTIPQHVHGAVLRGQTAGVAIIDGRLMVERHPVAGYPSDSIFNGSGDPAAYSFFTRARSGAWLPASRGELLWHFGMQPGAYPVWHMGLTDRPKTAAFTFDHSSQVAALHCPIERPRGWRNLLSATQHRISLIIDSSDPKIRRHIESLCRVVLQHMPLPVLRLVDEIRWTMGNVSDWENAAGQCRIAGGETSVEIGRVGTAPHEAVLWHEIGHCMERDAWNVWKQWTLACALDPCAPQSAYALNSWNEAFAESVRFYCMSPEVFREHCPYRATIIEAIACGAFTPMNDPQFDRRIP